MLVRGRRSAGCRLDFELKMEMIYPTIYFPSCGPTYSPYGLAASYELILFHKNGGKMGILGIYSPILTQFIIAPMSNYDRISQKMVIVTIPDNLHHLSIIRGNYIIYTPMIYALSILFPLRSTMTFVVRVIIIPCGMATGLVSKRTLAIVTAVPRDFAILILWISTFRSVVLL